MLASSDEMKTFDGQRIRPRPSRRRHQPSTQLTNHLLDGLRTLVGMRQIDGAPRKSAGLQIVIVTTGTVLCDKATLGINGHGRQTMHSSRPRDALPNCKNANN